jgi:uncharacterized RmlC-like cupin family protein
MSSDDPKDEVVVLNPPETGEAKQQIPVYFGVSERSAGAKALSLNLTAFPPGANSNTHLHDEFETAIYGVAGAVEIFYGRRLERSVVVTEGSFCFIPPGLPHKAYNLSESEPGLFVTARNDANEQESVVLVPEADDGSADERVRETRRRYAAGQL